MLARIVRSADCALLLAALLGCLALSACSAGQGGTEGVVAGVRVVSGRSNPDCEQPGATCTPEEREAGQRLYLRRPGTFLIEGRGTCAELIVDFGDGTDPAVMTDVALPAQISHTYRGWHGPKIVRVKGQRACLAAAETTVPVGLNPGGRLFFQLGIRPRRDICHAMPGMPSLRPDTTVAIKATDTVLEFGIGLQTKAGGVDDPTPSNFAFPTMRKFSVVYRVGGQLIQGRVGRVVFRTSERAPLEFCFNDDPAATADNDGGVGFSIEVSEPNDTIFRW